MLNAFYEIEQQFIEISRIIPFENQSTTYSPRLYDILQTSCGQIENLFRLCDELNLSYERGAFPLFYNALNSTGILKRQTIDYFPADFVAKPFHMVYQEITPFWWKAYNDTKHNLPEGYEQGNLRNTILSLAGVYALHCIGQYVVHFGDKVMNDSKWFERSGVAMNTLQPTIEVEWHHKELRPKSRIFYPVSFFKN